MAVARAFHQLSSASQRSGSSGDDEFQPPPPLIGDRWTRPTTVRRAADGLASYHSYLVITIAAL